ncbi:MAG: glycosyltransferase family 2 protein [Paracoccaceae bacterium]
MTGPPPTHDESTNVFLRGWNAYRLRWKRRRLLLRAMLKRRELTSIIDRTGQISTSDILLFSTVRNEALRLPFFLQHYRDLGVTHFLIVDNGSDDGTNTYLKDQSDVSLWSTKESYKNARFGVDWLAWLRIKYAHGHWCLTVDADEILIYPHWDTKPLDTLTNWLDDQCIPAFGAMMLELYPKGRTDQTPYVSGQDPTEVLNWFDAVGYWAERQWPLGNLWLQGGVRARVFFAGGRQRAPTLNKLPLVKWNRRYACVNSTHSMLPRKLNFFYDGLQEKQLSGVLLHTKFIHTIAAESIDEQRRAQHFHNGALYDEYYEQLSQSPDLWYPQAIQYRGWQQMVELGLMSEGDWCA